MRTGFQNTSVLHDDNAISVAHCAEPVCNYDDGPAPRDFPHVRLDDALGLVVKRAGSFIEDDDTWV